jgi:hypothetical protein
MKAPSVFLHERVEGALIDSLPPPFAFFASQKFTLLSGQHERTNTLAFPVLYFSAQQFVFFPFQVR